jgi:diguanylate cyclase (GGDEF)-like protein
VLFDLDHFKGINDTYGHPGGDAVLRRVANVAAELLRTEDVLARLGGEEFVMLFRAVPVVGAKRAAERLRRKIEGTTIRVGDGKAQVTISAGCAALSCLDEPTGPELLALADERLYVAKESGRNRVIAADTTF